MPKISPVQQRYPHPLTLPAKNPISHKNHPNQKSRTSAAVLSNTSVIRAESTPDTIIPPTLMQHCQDQLVTIPPTTSEMSKIKAKALSIGLTLVGSFLAQNAFVQAAIRTGIIQPNVYSFNLIKALPCFLKKLAPFGAFGITIPLGEEVLFRDLIQNKLLLCLPKAILNKVAPSKAHYLDTRIATIARVLLAASLFSAWHIQNVMIGIPDAAVLQQMVMTFVMGITWGLLAEKEGLPAAMAIHVINNMLVLPLTLPSTPC